MERWKGGREEGQERKEKKKGGNLEIPFHPPLFSGVFLLALQCVGATHIWFLQIAHLFFFIILLCYLLVWFLLSHIISCTAASSLQIFPSPPWTGTFNLVHSENHSIVEKIHCWIVEKIQSKIPTYIDFYPSWYLLEFLNWWVYSFYQIWKMFCCYFFKYYFLLSPPFFGISITLFLTIF